LIISSCRHKKRKDWENLQRVQDIQQDTSLSKVSVTTTDCSTDIKMKRACIQLVFFSQKKEEEWTPQETSPKESISIPLLFYSWGKWERIICCRKRPNSLKKAHCYT
jgi:hypothetical protein